MINLTGSPLLTKKDLSLALFKRRRDARAENPQYTESLFHNGFGSAKYVIHILVLRLLYFQ